MATVTWTGSTDTNFGTAGNWDTGSVPTSSDDVIIADVTNNCVLDGNRSVNSFKVESGGDYNGNTEMLTVVGENSSGFAVDIEGVIVGTNTDITIKTAASTTCDFHGSSGNFRNVTINHASCDVHISGNTTFDGNLTITAGTFDCSNEGGDSRNLTVAGDVNIANGGTLTGNASAISMGSLTIASGGTYNATSGTTTLTKDDTSQFLYETISGATFTNNDGTVLITGDGKLKPRAGTGNFHNLTINASGNTIDLSVALTCEGDLTITAGTLDTDSSNNYALTVTGDVTIAAAGTLTCNSSTVIVNSFTISSNGTLSLPDASGSCTITGSKSGWSLQNNSQSLSHNNGTVTQTGNGHHKSVFSNPLYNFVVNMVHLSHQATFRAAGVGGLSLTEVKVAANEVTVTRGTLQFNTSTDNAEMGSLTISNDGTYSATSGTTTITNKASTNFAFKNTGTFTHNSGTMQIGDGSTSTGGAHLMNTTYHNLIINRDQNAPDGNTPWRPSSGTEVTIAGNLTVTKGRFYRNNSSDSLVVTGDVDIAANGQVGTEAASGSNTFGGIRINSGGKYLATSGTTTVTNRFTGTSNVWKNDGGTFTHNNGTVKFTDNDHSLVKEAGSFYNFEQASSLGDYAILWETGGGGSCTILNNLTITRGDFEIHAAGDTLDIHGQTILNGSSDTGARFNNDKNQTGTITHHGIVTINGGTYHVEDGATVNMAGIRNLGGVVD